MTNSFQNLQVHSFPDISEIEFEGIDKNYLKVILLNTFIVFFILYVGLTIAVYSDVFQEITAYIYVFYLAITIFFSVTIFIKFIGFKKENMLCGIKIFLTKAVFFLNH